MSEKSSKWRWVVFAMQGTGWCAFQHNDTHAHNGWLNVRKGTMLGFNPTKEGIHIGFEAIMPFVLNFFSKDGTVNPSHVVMEMRPDARLEEALDKHWSDSKLIVPKPGQGTPVLKKMIENLHAAKAAGVR